MDASGSTVPWFLLPFLALWNLLTFILKLIGRILCAVSGLALMFAGGALTMTILGAWVGVPLFLFGFLLLVRALF